MSWTLLLGDCIEVMRGFADASIDAIVSDPPYGLEFMGKEWDGADGFRRSLNAADAGRDSVFGRSSRTGPEYRAGELFQRWCEAWGREALRVLKPGGHLLACGGTRTYHRLASGIEDAGFQVRDALDWIYGSGFPKSVRVCRAIDEQLCQLPGRHYWYAQSLPAGDKARPDDHVCPETPIGAAHAHEGTGLKPAHEPILLARRSLEEGETIASTVMRIGAGALDIEGCRVAGKDVPEGRLRHGGGERSEHIRQLNPDARNEMPAGRWPPNLLLTHSPDCGEKCAPDCPVMEMDRQSGSVGQLGPQLTGLEPSAAETGIVTNLRRRTAQVHRHIDSGGASRFFPVFRYCAKPSRSEKDHGCEDLEPKSGGEATGREDGSAGTRTPRAGAGRNGGARNYHPTVKPIALMEWLVKLVTPRGGVVLDPFCGSGTTGVAAARLELDFIGIEQSSEYLEIARRRIRVVSPDGEGQVQLRAATPSRQMSLLDVLSATEQAGRAS